MEAQLKYLPEKTWCNGAWECIRAAPGLGWLPSPPQNRHGCAAATQTGWQIVWPAQLQQTAPAGNDPSYGQLGAWLPNQARRACPCRCGEIKHLGEAAWGWLMRSRQGSLPSPGRNPIASPCPDLGCWGAHQPHHMDSGWQGPETWAQISVIFVNPLWSI